MPAKNTMTDKEYMEDVLLTAKTLTGLYHYATQESVTPPLHSQFQTNLNETLGMQNSIFCTMQQNGWYPVQQAQAQQVSQVRTKFSG
jgi:spore coat protein CotF